MFYTGSNLFDILVVEGDIERLGDTDLLGETERFGDIDLFGDPLYTVELTYVCYRLTLSIMDFFLE